MEQRGLCDFNQCVLAIGLKKGTEKVFKDLANAFLFCDIASKISSFPVMHLQPDCFEVLARFFDRVTF